jgi:transcriptional regulator with XRE-family HTH domain
MELNQMLPERLKAARLARGLTQSQLAEKTGLHLKAISKYEQGVILPGADTLQKLITALAISADFLLIPEAKMEGIPKIKDPDLLERYLEIEDLNPKEKEALLTLIDSLLARRRLRELGKAYSS